jgi:Domain of unknown function (DUF4326)
MSVQVVKVNQKRNNFNRYIGRTWRDMLQSAYHNPFHVGKDGDRSEVILKFILYWYSPRQVSLRARALNEIKETDVLGCWCKPLDCHGDIIAGYLDWKRHQEELPYE